MKLSPGSGCLQGQPLVPSLPCRSLPQDGGSDGPFPEPGLSANLDKVRWVSAFTLRTLPAGTLTRAPRFPSAELLKHLPAQ